MPKPIPPFSSATATPHSLPPHWNNKIKPTLLPPPSPFHLIPNPCSAQAQTIVSRLHQETSSFQHRTSLARKSRCTLYSSTTVIPLTLRWAPITVVVSFLVRSHLKMISVICGFDALSSPIWRREMAEVIWRRSSKRNKRRRKRRRKRKERWQSKD